MIPNTECAKVISLFSIYFFFPQTFGRYLTFRKDSHQLLLFLLKQLSQDQMAFQRNRYGTQQDTVQIAEKDLADKVFTFLGTINSTLLIFQTDRQDNFHISLCL